MKRTVFLNDSHLYEFASEDFKMYMCHFAELVRDSQNLLKWFQLQLELYRNLVRVFDLTASWQSGVALCALIHKYRPEILWVPHTEHTDTLLPIISTTYKDKRCARVCQYSMAFWK